MSFILGVVNNYFAIDVIKKHDIFVPTIGLDWIGKQPVKSLYSFSYFMMAIIVALDFCGG